MNDPQLIETDFGYEEVYPTKANATMTEQEYNALLVILNRTPLTPAEALWLNELLARLRPQVKQDTKDV